MRTAILHIGTEKTGTTTIQEFLTLNRAALAALGWAYPTCCGRNGCHRLAMYAMNVERCEDLHLQLDLDSEEKRRSFNAEVKEHFLREISALPHGIHTV